MKRYFMIEKAILRIIDRQGQANWHQIMLEVGEALLITDWMEVRDVIQNLKNQQTIYRASDVRNEVYLRVGSMYVPHELGENI